MKISLISTSHREKSQSARISKILKEVILKIDNRINCYNLDMYESKIPLWTADRNEDVKFWENEFKTISNELKTSDGFIVVVPEYGGMATPNSKNLFLTFNKGEFFHKPGLIVSISSGNGGSYPISDLRSSSYKNSHINWIPENIIIKNVEHFDPGNHGNLIPAWLDKRIDYVLNLLIEYSKCLRPVGKLINRKDFGNGM